MSHIQRGFVFAFCFALLIQSTNAQDANDFKPAPKLSKRAQSLLEQKIVPAYRLGDPLQLANGLASVTSRMKPEQLAAFDEQLRMLAMPTAGKMMVDSYMSLLTQGQIDGLPEPGVREIVTMVPALDTSIMDVLRGIDESVATVDPLPVLEKLEDYEGLLWEIHVLENKIKYTFNYARYGVALIEQAKKKRSRGFEEQLEKLAVDFEGRVDELEAAQWDLHQRKMEFRLDRLDLAKRVLVAADSSFIEKLQAAFAGQLDAAAFSERFALPEPRAFDRERLADTQLRENVKSLADGIEGLSGDLKEKSNLLFRGLHWWQRGRYGSGPEQGGMLKNVRVVNDDRFLFPLFIPEDMGKPPFELIRNPDWDVSGTAAADPEMKPYVRVRSADGLKPDVPRRHHFAWMFEYRQHGAALVGSNTQSIGSVGTSETISMKHKRPVFY